MEDVPNLGEDKKEKTRKRRKLPSLSEVVSVYQYCIILLASRRIAAKSDADAVFKKFLGGKSTDSMFCSAII